MLYGYSCYRKLVEITEILPTKQKTTTELMQSDGKSRSWKRNIMICIYNCAISRSLYLQFKQDFLVNSQLDTGNNTIQKSEIMNKAIQDVESYLFVVLSDKNLAR